ncbi:hypothetical protein BCR36DRAFT_372577 [Piromyces finnis]|uniref:PB1 domain-containing protein n=1 Tax=Piromyces finnis TaxID=1754191 RepID=A0A1Y1V2J6_9FUNG|nr:hypothetical protein BCR36DRAFT_372577 [Piromyces finnis]|eukprot:ORX45792.1 hypothetical protein BCR36DRAFT_372577 [Piromyces finnis]
MSFITVKYGNNSEKIFNPNCVASVLLSFIKISCGFDEEKYQVDLATESGEVIDLANHGKEYAKKYLDERRAYILVKIIEGEDDSPTTYSPLLEQIPEKMKFTVISSGKNRQKRAGNDSDTSKQKAPSSAGKRKVGLSHNNRNRAGTVIK